MPRKINWSIYLLLLVIAGFSVGCYPTRKLKKNEEWLLKSNNVRIADKCEVPADELTTIVKQRPNRSIGFSVPVPSLWHSNFKWDLIILRLNLRAFNLGSHSQWRFFKWLQNKIGEPPVIYDSTLTTKSVEQIEEYMFQHGYFDNHVEVQTKYNKTKKMVRVAYVVHPAKPYYINSIKPIIQDPLLNNFYQTTVDKTLIKTGDIYNYDKLEAERQRIVAVFQNNGYFEFNRDHIRFDVDTNLNDHKVNVNLVIRNQIIKNDSTNYSKAHVRYFPRYYYVYPDFDFFSNKIYRDTITMNNIKIVYNGKLAINQRLIYHNMLFEKPYYKQEEANLTYKSFTSLNLYKNIRIEFKKVTEGDKRDLLDGYVYLSPLKRNSFSTEARVETRANSGSSGIKNSYNLGVSGNLSYQRRNAFRNGELLKITMSAGLEPFFLSDSAASQNFFNTTELGPTISITFPRFLLPIRQDKFAKSARAKTIIVASFNTLKNDDIRRRASRLTLSYEWNETPKKKHIVNPAEFSLVKADLSETINKRLIAIGDPFLKNTYSDQLILGTSYTFIYSDQYDSKSTKALYNRSKIEATGNLLREIAKSSTTWEQNNAGSYLINNIPFAQYLKLENEFKTYKQTFYNNIVAFRLYTGIAKPLQNLQSLPFEKSFFAGGSNGIRAWGARSLGPGSYLDTTTFKGYLNRLGEIHLESNLEYRFKITKLLEWAFFADVGNIWVFKENGIRTNTEFTSQFYKQLALGAGFGARLDFDFFIFRFDVAFPLHDPSKPEGERWFNQSKTEYNNMVDRYNDRNQLSGNNRISHYKIKPNFNLGIGYPF